MITKDNVKARLAHLQAIAAKSTAITIESICRELDEANAIAKANGQAFAMVSTSTLRTKKAGLLTEKVEAKVDIRGNFDNCLSTADIADELLMGAGGPVEQFRPVDERDRKGLIALFDQTRKPLVRLMQWITTAHTLKWPCPLYPRKRTCAAH